MRHFHLGEGVDSLADMRAELEAMTDVLMGREQPPIDKGVMTLMEVADAYYARAKEMEMMILQGEADGTILKNSRTYRFRTGQLRSFIDIAKAASELGSRRVTAERLEYDLANGGY